MSTYRQASPESVIDRDREELIAKIIAGTADQQERARLEELSSARAALMKKPMLLRSAKRGRLFLKRAS